MRSINHRTHGFEGLSRLTANAIPADEIHTALSARGIESLLLGTCNRRELYWRAQTETDDAMVTGLLASAWEVDAEVLTGRSPLMTGRSVANHLFRVCAGLESAVMGEAEILGQVRAALDACPSAGPFLTGVFQAALRAGGAARAETAIGEGALSVASTAIQWLSAQMPLGDRRVLILGAGNTARKAARHLKALGVGSLVIANRTRSRAEALAAPLNADTVSLDQLPEELRNVDAIISAVSVRDFVITNDQLGRRDSPRTLVVIDLSMPPSIEPGESSGVVRIDLTLLDKAAEANRRKRASETPGVEAVIARELACFERWARRETARPMMAARRREVDVIRQAELARANAELKGSADPKDVLDRFSRRLLDRMLTLDRAGLEEQDA